MNNRKYTLKYWLLGLATSQARASRIAFFWQSLCVMALGKTGDFNIALLKSFIVFVFFLTFYFYFILLYNTVLVDSCQCMAKPFIIFDPRLILNFHCK